eukprot:9008680-Pyramimonas_sp.AAC.1
MRARYSPGPFRQKKRRLKIGENCPGSRARARGVFTPRTTEGVPRGRTNSAAPPKPRLETRLDFSRLSGVGACRSSPARSPLRIGRRGPYHGGPL